MLGLRHCLSAHQHTPRLSSSRNTSTTDNNPSVVSWIPHTLSHPAAYRYTLCIHCPRPTPRTYPQTHRNHTRRYKRTKGATHHTMAAALPESCDRKTHRKQPKKAQGHNRHNHRVVSGSSHHQVDVWRQPQPGCACAHCQSGAKPKPQFRPAHAPA